MDVRDCLSPSMPSSPVRMCAGSSTSSPTRGSTAAFAIDTSTSPETAVTRIRRSGALSMAALVEAATVNANKKEKGITAASSARARGIGTSLFFLRVVVCVLDRAREAADASGRRGLGGGAAILRALAPALNLRAFFYRASEPDVGEALHAQKIDERSQLRQIGRAH